MLAAAALSAPAAGASAQTPAATSAAPPSATPTATPAGSGAAAVVLPTGDRVVVGTGAVGVVTIAEDADASDAFMTLVLGGDTYVVPAQAQPYLDHGLDLSLFDVTKLAAAGHRAGGRIPVVLRFAAGVTPTAPAGVTLTAVSGQTATGYLTPDSGHAFAQALRDGIKADLAAGHPAGTGALFGGLASMTAPGASTPVQPNYPLHILQLNAVDDSGGPANLSILLMNTDNARLYNGRVESYQGVARAAVPAGHYAAFALNYAFDPQAHTAKQELVPVEGITVPDSGPVPPVTVDIRAATTPVTFTTQKPATRQLSETTYVRTAAVGGLGAGVVMIGGSLVDTYVAPTAKPATGSLYYQAAWIGQSPAAAAAPYRYNLAAVSDHFDANQSYAPADSSLATLLHTAVLDPHYGTTPPALGSGTPSPLGTIAVSLEAPGAALTEYVTGGLRWLSEMQLPRPAPTPGGTPTLAFLQSDPRLYTAGQTVARTWGAAPMAPEFGRHVSAAANLFGCQACASGTAVNAVLGMLGDANPDTTGLDLSASGTAQLYWNGKLVSSDVDQLGYVLTDVPAGPATMRMVLDYDRTASGITQSARTHTDVTIPYPGHDDPSMVLPAGTPCDAATAAGDPSAPCQVLPALTLNYRFKDLTDRNVAQSPAQNLVLRVGHLSYGHVGSKAHITSAQVSVSFDGGATWRDVPTRGGDGTYTAHWANPAPGAHVALRVTATDCLGGSITQTVTDPYTVQP
ncbi:MAG: hypothetical protein HOV87_31325 [Catenulispora sp.]|nr:hypothetical protein [Catenulispora sp.]